MPKSLQPHELQHARLPCPSPPPRFSSNSCSLTQWCHPTISSAVATFTSCLQSFPASGSFSVSQSFVSGGQSTGASASASASVLPMNIQGWFPLGLTILISLLFKWLSSVLQHHSSKASILWHSSFFIVQLSHSYMTTGKTIALTRWTFVGKVMALLFNILSIMAPHSSILAWKIPWTEEPGRLQSMGSLRVGHDWTTSLSLFTCMHWRRKWQPTPAFLPGESQGRQSLVGCSLWSRTESDTTEAT